MKTRLFCLYMITSLLFWQFSFQPSVYALSKTSIQELEQSLWVQALASLTYHTDQLCQQLEKHHPETHPQEEPDIQFSDEEASILWHQAAHTLHQLSVRDKQADETDLNQAYKNYQHAKSSHYVQDQASTKNYLQQATKLLSNLWEKACAEEELHCGAIAKQQVHAQFENNPHISKKAKNQMRPYLIPLTHPMKRNLDLIFASRVTMTESNFKLAGFNIVSVRPRTYIYVAGHPWLPGYLIKANMDTETREKRDKPSWYWLVQRCIGAEKIRRVIEKKKIKHFVVANKWIYPLPAEPSPPKSSQFTRHLAVLLVTDMQLVPKLHNHHAWQHYITKSHLDELYIILSRAKGSSYRPDNIWYTKNKQFAFIDTEYPDHKPDYRSIRRYLSKEMRNYWDSLVKSGGKK